MFKQVVLLGVLPALAALPAAGEAQERGQQASPVAGPQRIDMVVHGLSCPFCAYGLEKKLRKLEGLDSVSIDFRTGNVLLLVQDGSKATDERLQQPVKDAGFHVAEIKRAPRPGSPPRSGERGA